MAGSIGRLLLAWGLGISLAHADCTSQIDSLEGYLFIHPGDLQAIARLKRLLADPRCRLPPVPQPSRKARISPIRYQGELSALWSSNPVYAPEHRQLTLWLEGQRQTFRLTAPQTPKLGLQIDLQRIDPIHHIDADCTLRRYRDQDTDLHLALYRRHSSATWGVAFDHLLGVDSLALSLATPFRGSGLPVGLRIDILAYPFLPMLTHADIDLTMQFHKRGWDIRAMGGVAPGLRADYPGRTTWHIGILGRRMFVGDNGWRHVLQLQLQFEQDTHRWSALLAAYAPRRVQRLTLAARSIKRLHDDRHHFFVALVYSRQWSNIPLFAWQSIGLQTGMVLKW